MAFLALGCSTRFMSEREPSMKNEEFRKWWNQWVATLSRLRGTAPKPSASVHDMQTGQKLFIQSRKVRSDWLSYIA